MKFSKDLLLQFPPDTMRSAEPASTLPQALVLFGMGSLPKHWSFPRKRESCRRRRISHG